MGGYLNKQWVSYKHLYKYGKNTDIEVDVCLLCKAYDVPVNEVTKTSDGICIENFTNPTVMLEQADQSGMIDPDDFYESDIIRLFGIRGVQMLIIDAIIGNGDRHAGNFGWLRDTDTGRYLSLAPLYDFDHALDSTLSYDRLIEDAVIESIKANYANEVYRIARRVVLLETNRVFKMRAMEIIKLLDSLLL